MSAAAAVGLRDTSDDPEKGPYAVLAPGSARSMLLTLLGELVWRSGAPAWTSALVEVLTGLGIEERAARQAIARAAQSGWITPNRVGREVSWTLTPRFDRVFEEGSRRVGSLSEPFDDWDGSWLVLLVTIPQSQRSERKRLYSDLTWAGLGNPAPGVWVSPHPERKQVVAGMIDARGLADSTMAFIGRVEQVGLDVRSIVRRGWDLEDLAARYAAVEEAFRDADPAPGDETLHAHLRLLGEWQTFPFSDPQLPEALEPDWIGRRVSRRIELLRSRWTEDAHRRWSELNASS